MAWVDWSKRSCSRLGEIFNLTTTTKSNQATSHNSLGIRIQAFQFLQSNAYNTIDASRQTVLRIKFSKKMNLLRLYIMPRSCLNNNNSITVWISTMILKATEVLVVNVKGMSQTRYFRKCLLFLLLPR